MRSRSRAVQVLLIACSLGIANTQRCDAQTAPDPGVLDAIEEAVLDSGPYPRRLVVTIPPKIGSDAPRWQVAVVRLLVEKSIAEVMSESEGIIEWRPLARMESKVRRNMDHNYRLLDYGVNLGTLDADVSEIQVRADGGASARVDESLRKASLYDGVLKLLPESNRDGFRAHDRTVGLRDTEEGWTIQP